jgi:DNA polymerase-1
MQKVLIIDTMNLMHRARYGFGDGPHKVFFNFFRMLKGELKNHDPDLVYIVDEGRASISKELSADYKANRQKTEDPDFWREKSEILHTIINQSGFVYIRHPERECDDVIGHLATVTHRDDEVTIVSTDSDFIQLISDTVKLWHPKKKKYLDPWYCDYLTWKALKGDPTDNVSGVSGVGTKRADMLTQNPDELLKFLNEGEKAAERQQQFKTSYELIKLKSVPLEGLQVAQSDFISNQMFEEFQKRNCKSIIGKAWPKWVDAFNKAGGKNDFEH